MPGGLVTKLLERYFLGQPVVYRQPKQGTSPGPRARNLRPARHGESYVYNVDKYWRVVEFLDNNELRLLTRRGKTHIVKRDDPQLRPASWWERIYFWGRFPVPPETV